MKFVLLLMIFVVSTACKKEQSFDFPSGKFVMIERTIKENPCSKYDKPYGNNIKGIFQNEFQYNSIEMEFDGRNKIAYRSNKGVETFKIKKVTLASQTDSSKTLILHLKNKKGKSFEFEYENIGDSILIGDYWIKNKPYFTYKEQNFCSVKCEYYVDVGNGLYKLYESYFTDIEELVVYKKTS